MHTNKRVLRIAGLVGGLAWAWSAAACVSSGTYEAARLEAKRAKVQLLQEQRKVSALEERNKQLAQRVDKWVDELWLATERVEGIARNWRDLRDELVRLRIDRELQRQRERDGITGAAMRLELEPEPSDAPPATQNPIQRPGPVTTIRPRIAQPDEAPPSAPSPSVDTRRGVKALLEELKELLEE